MKNIVNLSQRIVDRNIDTIVKKYGLVTKDTIISMAGGFALNCPTNSYLLQKYKFADYQIPPCTSDTGIAAGVGIAAFYAGLQNAPVIKFDSAYYGHTATFDEPVLEKYKGYIESVDNVSLDDIVQDIMNDGVIVWVNGNAEIGPRALGNRSLIGDPRYMQTKDILNTVKKRQWWRPVAPVVLDEYGTEWFDDYVCSPNMLLNFVVKPQYLDKVPAILHFDNTARVQSVSADSNPALHDLLTAFCNKTGVPILCNTSLNDAGEPIINNLDQAIAFALHKGIKCVYCNSKIRIKVKTDGDLYGKGFDYRAEQFFAQSDTANVDAIVKEQNPYNLSIKELTYFFDDPHLFSGCDIRKKEDAQLVKEQTAQYLEKNPDALQR